MFIGETLKPLLERLPEDDSVAALMEAAERARGEAYEQVAATLDERRYTRLQLQLDLWLESDGGRGGDAIEGANQPGPWNRPAVDVAREVLAVRHRKVRKLAKRFEELEDEQRHQLRINAKKARYAAEFFRGLFPRKVAQNYARRLAEMQDCLGPMNDAVVGRRLVEELIAAGADLGRANDLLVGWHAARIAGDMPRGARIARKVAKLDPFWEEEV